MITVVIPTYNEETQLPKLLASLKAQSVQPADVIVADAQSTDRTREVAASFGARVIDGGLPGVGRNRGAALAKTEYILFLDSDVELFDVDFLKKVEENVNRRHLDIGSFGVYPISSHKIDHVLHGMYNGYIKTVGNFIPHAGGFCIIVRRSLHEKIGGFDETVLFAEDNEYTRRASRAGRYGVLRLNVPMSVRRMERDGRMNVALKYALVQLHIIFIGPVRDDRFRYSFGYGKSPRKRVQIKDVSKK